MMKRLWHFSFLLPSIAFLLHQLMQKLLNIPFPIIDNYLDPFCFGALIPPLLLIERQLLFKQTEFPQLEFIILLLILVIFSEILLPLVSSNFFADPLDAVFILLGGIWFWNLGKKLN
tara:strand:+ start:1305 stop:1655 length:351 start_codon:yes stop_codon:yes gene_type:complete